MIVMDDSRTMTFQSGEFSNSLFQKLFEQKRASRFCDVNLFVNNRIIKAHRNVLACSSPYFDSILKHRKVIREQLTVSCLDSEIFNTILNFMYTGQITIEHSNVEELLKLSDHFMLTKVIEYCIEFLGTKLCLNNCLFTYFLTNRFKLKHLGNIVENWIATHIEDICKGDEILRLSAYELQNFLKNKNFSLTTSRALNLLSEWVQLDIGKRERNFEILIKCFPTNDLEPIEVFKHLDTCSLYIKSELCLYKFLDYLLRNNWMLSNFKTRYDVLHVKYGQMLLIDKLSDTETKNDRISVSEKTQMNNTQDNSSSVVVKAKMKNRKQMILKKLMLFGLRPSVRMAALKMLACKKKCISLNENEKDNSDVEDPDEKVGIKCPICFMTINDSLLLEQHLALSHAKDVTYKCGLCAFVCQYHGDYLNHMKTHFTGPPFKCDYCDFSIDQISKLISHRAQHLEESIYNCTFCSFKCRQKHNYISHMKMHTPEKTYKCEHCTKSFRFKQNLESHLLTHASEKSLSCDSCGFHTKYLSHMIAHKRIHASDVFRCSYPHCKYTASKKAQLSSHARAHAHGGARPHACAVCGRGFMEKSHLVRHERIHLDEKPFGCAHCDYASSRRDKLKEHYARHHGENASAKVPYKARPMRNAPATKAKTQTPQEVTPTTSTNNANFTQTSSASVTPSSQTMGSEIQDLIMHHQNHSASTATNLATSNANYHHFGDPADFHHAAHAHNLHSQILGGPGGHGQRPSAPPHNTNIVNHHMLAAARSNPSTSTAAAVAAAMMLDPRFHHNPSVPYHSSSTPVSMAMAAVQSSQQIQSSGPPNEYPSTIQNCMTLF